MNYVKKLNLFLDALFLNLILKHSDPNKFKFSLLIFF